MPPKLVLHTLALAASCLALASCGGGSSTSTTTAPPASGGPSSGGPATGAQPTVFEVQGGGELILNGDGTAVFQGTALSPGGAAARFGGAQVFAGNGLVLERLGPATGLSVTDFGAWYAPNASPTAMNFFAAGMGAPSTGAALPMSGSASYSGTYVAVLGGSPVTGGVSITIPSFAAPVLAIDIGFSGPITIGGGGTVNRSTGTYTFSGGPDAPRGGALNGQGALFGNGAPETAGTFSGTTVGNPGIPTNTNQPFSGSFGAHR